MGHMLRLKVDPERSFHMEFSREKKAVLLGWLALTEVINVQWVRLITLRLGWPPIHSWSGFTSPDWDIGQ